MAVTLKVQNKTKIFHRKFNDLQHHRNPSGLHNKVNWILKQMNWDLNNLDRVWDSIVWVEPKSWELAFDLVIYILKPKHLASPCVVRGDVYKRKYEWFRKLVEKSSEK